MELFPRGSPQIMSVSRSPRASGLAVPGVAMVSTSCRHLLCNVHHCMSNPERSSAMRLWGVVSGGQTIRVVSSQTLSLSWWLDLAFNEILLMWAIPEWVPPYNLRWVGKSLLLKLFQLKFRVCEAVAICWLARSKHQDRKLLIWCLSWED